MSIQRREHDGFRWDYIESSNADAVLFLDLTYSFTPEFDKLYVSTFAMVFPNKRELRPYQEAHGNKEIIELSDNIYRNQFVALISPDVIDGTKEENAAYWAELSKEELTGFLDVAGLQLADALANDIGIDNTAIVPVINNSTVAKSDTTSSDLDLPDAGS